MHNKPHSEETKRKISENTKKSLSNPQVKFKLRLSNLGRKQSLETRKKRSLSMKGKNTWMKGKPMNDNIKRKISKTMKGIKKSEQTRIKMSISQKGHKKYNGMTGKHHTQETIEKYREKRKNWVCPKKDTLIEVKVREFLDSLKIEYFQHKYMNISHAYQCDFFIPSINLIIECDGNYWHKYPIGNDIDHIRTSELIEKGFKVLRLWEFEIKKMDIDEFKRRLEYHV